MRICCALQGNGTMKRCFLAIAIVLAFVIVGLGGSPARAKSLADERSRDPATRYAPAAPHSKSTLHQTSERPQHCITGPNQPLQCFDTEAQALLVASGRGIDLAAGETSRSLSDTQLFNTSIQAILYEHTNHTGSTLTVTSGGCYGWNNMPSNWNDRVSSARTGSCGISLYEHYNLAGLRLRIDSPGTYYVGDAMNDKASSWSLP